MKKFKRILGIIIIGSVFPFYGILLSIINNDTIIDGIILGLTINVSLSISFGVIILIKWCFDL